MATLKPDRLLLQNKVRRGSATLANGVKCGDMMLLPPGLATTGSQGSITGWRDYISFSGQLMEGLWPNPTEDADQTFRVRDETGPDLLARRGLAHPSVRGARILGVMTNSVMPELVRVVIDVGEDEEQPGQHECDTAMLTVYDLDAELIDLLKFWRMLPDDLPT